MGSIVAKGSNQDAGQHAGSRPEPPSRSSASTASVRSVGIPLPLRPPPARRREQTSAATTTSPLPSPTPPSTNPTDAESLSECSLNDAQNEPTPRGEMLARCLAVLEGGFGLTFEREQLLDSVREVRCRPGQTLLSAKQTAIGVYVVEEGGLEVLSPNEDVVLGVLGVGDFCGELSSFFHTPCTATVRAQRGGLR